VEDGHHLLLGGLFGFLIRFSRNERGGAFCRRRAGKKKRGGRKTTANSQNNPARHQPPPPYKTTHLEERVLDVAVHHVHRLAPWGEVAEPVLVRLERPRHLAPLPAERGPHPEVCQPEDLLAAHQLLLRDQGGALGALLVARQDRRPQGLELLDHLGGVPDVLRAEGQFFDHGCVGEAARGLVAAAAGRRRAAAADGRGRGADVERDSDRGVRRALGHVRHAAHRRHVERHEHAVDRQQHGLGARVDGDLQTRAAGAGRGRHVGRRAVGDGLRRRPPGAARAAGAAAGRGAAAVALGGQARQGLGVLARQELVLARLALARVVAELGRVGPQQLLAPARGGGGGGVVVGRRRAAVAVGAPAALRVVLGLGADVLACGRRLFLLRRPSCRRRRLAPLRLLLVVVKVVDHPRRVLGRVRGGDLGRRAARLHDDRVGDLEGVDARALVGGGLFAGGGGGGGLLLAAAALCLDGRRRRRCLAQIVLQPGHAQRHEEAHACLDDARRVLGRERRAGLAQLQADAVPDALARAALFEQPPPGLARARQRRRGRRVRRGHRRALDQRRHGRLLRRQEGRVLGLHLGRRVDQVGARHHRAVGKIARPHRANDGAAVQSPVVRRRARAEVVVAARLHLRGKRDVDVLGLEAGVGLGGVGDGRVGELCC